MTRVLPEDVRFWRHVRADGDCWTWTGTKNQDGYGMFRVGTRPNSRMVFAHRWAWEFLRGEIPVGLSLDHLCRNRACANPDHLDPVSHRTNVLRGMSPSVVIHRSGLCAQGHDLSDARIQPNGRGGTRRRCRTCARQYEARYNAKRRSA